MAQSADDKTVLVGTGSTGVLDRNPNRKFATFVNDSDQTIYVFLGSPAVLNTGIRLNAFGGNYEINATNLFTGPVTAICLSGGKNLVVMEG